jgi:hypothetical protein
MSKWSVHPIKREPSRSEKVVIKDCEGLGRIEGELHWGQHPIYYGAARTDSEKEGFPVKKRFRSKAEQRSK